MAEFANCSLWKNLENIFAVWLTKKYFIKHIENYLPQHLSEKFIDYRYLFTKLRFIDYRIAQSFLEIIDYHYCFSTDRFIVPITGCRIMNW